MLSRIIKNTLHLISGLLAICYYRCPARRLTIIGVTGTDGKTTTTSLVYHILQTAGKKTALITTLGAKIGDESYDSGFHVTTPGAWLLQKYLRRAADAGVTHVALEVSSHSLDQYRVVGIPFKVGVLTNITHEHLDYHRTYENYVATKARLLKRANIAIINRDDGSYPYVVQQLPSTIFETYSLHHSEATLTLDNFPFTTKLIGEFNLYNILAASSATRAVGISDEAIKKAIATFEAPEGRQKMVYDREFKVMIDFAHTPNAFEKILPAVRAITPGRLIHVFGSAGLRDVTKRPLMGEASARYADIIILTAEDPRGEAVGKINSELVAGVKEFSKITREAYTTGQKKIILSIPNRSEAIEFAIQIAESNDTVLFTGKSHEQSMNYDGKTEEPWDETKEVLSALKKRSQQ